MAANSKGEDWEFWLVVVPEETFVLMVTVIDTGFAGSVLTTTSSGWSTPFRSV
jgi:ATP adenylyltransferase/5',5'''-P-1,P-4-tetraphosphate phosphorylase II